MPTMNSQLNRLLLLKRECDSAFRNFNRACREAFQEGAHVTVLFDNGRSMQATTTKVAGERVWLAYAGNDKDRPKPVTFAWLATHNAGTW